MSYNSSDTAHNLWTILLEYEVTFEFIETTNPLRIVWTAKSAQIASLVRSALIDLTVINKKLSITPINEFGFIGYDGFIVQSSDNGIYINTPTSRIDLKSTAEGLTILTMSKETRKTRPFSNSEIFQGINRQKSGFTKNTICMFDLIASEHQRYHIVPRCRSPNLRNFRYNLSTENW
jgi:hypothetical protein